MTKVFSKQQTQQVIRDMRKAGYTVEKDARGAYTCEFEGDKVFTALPGHRGYLVTYSDKLLTAAK
jgi:hypothetical protein